MPTDTQAALQREQRLLLASTATAAGFAAVGIVWGWWAQSQIILLDGMYALIGLGLGLLSLRAARLVEAGPTPKYPFGREALAPLVVGIQGVVLLGTFGFAAIDSVGVILEGGSETAIGAALVYAVVSLLASLLIWWYLRARGEDSELVQAEAAQWAAGWVLSAGMMVGFTTGLILKSTTAANLAGYVDPVLVLVATAVILPTPLRMIRSMYTELLEGRPPREVSEPINDIVHLVSAEHGLPDPTVRMGKLGRKVYLEIDYLVGPGAEIGTADLVRRDLIERLNEPGRLLWINVELHTDPQWDEV
jgi:cation diffusion facilitator family transporter